MTSGGCGIPPNVESGKVTFPLFHAYLLQHSTIVKRIQKLGWFWGQKNQDFQKRRNSEAVPNIGHWVQNKWQVTWQVQLKTSTAWQQSSCHRTLYRNGRKFLRYVTAGAPVQKFVSWTLRCNLSAKFPYAMHRSTVKKSHHMARF